LVTEPDSLDGRRSQDWLTSLDNFRDWLIRSAA
jgi:hypothetical protein